VKPSMLKRAKVLFIEYIVCSLVTWGFLLASLVMSRADVGSLVWLAVGWLVPHLGPIGLLLVMSPPPLSKWLWWAILVGTNIAFILAYLVRPNIATAIISFLGIAIWFFFGFMAMMSGV